MDLAHNMNEAQIQLMLYKYGQYQKDAKTSLECIHLLINKMETKCQQHPYQRDTVGIQPSPDKKYVDIYN